MSNEQYADIWKLFCAKLADAGDVLTRPGTPSDPLDQAEGLRYLSRLTRTALNMIVDSGDPDFPRIFMMCDDTLKIGADNPDNIYQQFVVRGDREYRLWGKRGTVPYLSLGSKANRYAIDGTMASTGELEFADVKLEKDGSFEIFISKKRNGAKNWLSMSDDTSLVIIRQTFEDKATQIPATFNVERTSPGPEHPKPLTPEEIKQKLFQTVAWVHGTAKTFCTWSEDFKTQPNKIYEASQQRWQRAGGDIKIWYGHAYYDLKPDEAWVIRTKVPKNRFWNFQLDNWWMESLDYSHRKIWINGSQAKYEKDGSVVLVCAARDPGFGNWLDIADHPRGTALWRWVEAEDTPTPQCEVIKLPAAAPKKKSAAKAPAKAATPAKKKKATEPA
jgi:hypothetical protein